MFNNKILQLWVFYIVVLFLWDDTNISDGCTAENMTSRTTHMGVMVVMWKDGDEAG